jgi:peptidoglycan/xylan/chitin deacetylase (PgdA/CDA1 family)
VPWSAFREIARDREPEFLRRGYRPRHVFAHRLYQLPKCGPDGYKLALDACGIDNLSAHWQLLLYAGPSLVEEFPSEVFFDDDVMWHRQQFGRPGQVASATLVLDGRDAYSLVHQSDLVQRIGRIPGWRSRIENRFKGWPYMLLNGLLAFARERGAVRLRTPTASLAMRHTDPARDVEPDLFERVYDRPVERFSPDRRDGWWVIDLDPSAEAIVLPKPGREELRRDRTVCVCHDIERGLGHLDIDPEFARRADVAGARNLSETLAVEEAAGISATYQVVGMILPEVQAELMARGHCVAFHSYDHSVADEDEDFVGSSTDQLAACRKVDYRIKGYRPPRSRVSGALGDERLAFHNFEWLANSGYVMGTYAPALTNRVVKLPITVDDFALHMGRQTYGEWEEEVLEEVARRPFVSIGLHDCYAHHWLPHYPELLEKLCALASPATHDEVAAELFLAHAV